jgi:hypothetical protein
MKTRSYVNNLNDAKQKFSSFHHHPAIEAPVKNQAASLLFNYLFLEPSRAIYVRRKASFFSLFDLTQATMI